MSRGSQKLYKDLNEPIEINHRRGRSIEYNKLRNDCLIDRYIFYLITTRNNYEAIISDLANDFFLSPVTIQNVLSMNYDNVVSLKKLYSGCSHKKINDTLKKKWTQYAWNSNN